MVKPIEGKVEQAQNFKNYSEFLTALRAAGKTGINTMGASKMKPRYGAYLETLYYLGYVVESKHTGIKGVWEYKLVYEPRNLLKRDDCKIGLFKYFEEKYDISQAELEEDLKELDMVLRYKDKHFFNRNVKHMRNEIATGQTGIIVNPELFKHYFNHLQEETNAQA